MVMAAAVIEHCPSYIEFIHRALDVNSELIVITFFRSLLWEEDRLCKTISPEAVYYENHYKAENLIKWLDDEGLSYQFHTIKGKVTDVILIIDVRGGVQEKITRIVEGINLTDPGYGEWQRDEVLASRKKSVK